jgi:ssDNA-binding Zn-finger/Zn-ribbon topoisomerase 1
MPRKARITAVPVEQEQQGVSEDPVEQKTDAEQMTDIINEVNTTSQSDAPPSNAEEEVAEESLPDGGQTKGPKPKPKARAKRAPSRGPSVRLKHNVIEPEPEPEPEVQAELPVEEVKVDAKVECPDCGKMMSQKTLRYSHGPNCVAKKQKTMTEDNLQSASDDWVEHEVQRRLYGRREERATRREAMVAKLVQNAF